MKIGLGHRKKYILKIGRGRWGTARGWQQDKS